MVKDHVVAVSVSEDTKKEIEEAAEKAALDTSTFVRHKIKTKVLGDGETA